MITKEEIQKVLNEIKKIDNVENVQVPDEIDVYVVSIEKSILECYGYEVFFHHEDDKIIINNLQEVPEDECSRDIADVITFAEKIEERVIETKTALRYYTNYGSWDVITYIIPIDKWTKLVVMFKKGW